MSDNSFLIRKLHSLSGVLPIGIFLIVHLTINSFAIKGSEAYNAKVAFLTNMPLIWVAEIFFIAIPILFHAIYGIYIVYVAKNNILQYNYYRNWSFYLQRISAILTLLFLIIHVYATRISNLLYGTEVGFGMMVDILSNPATLVFYIVGLVASVYHFTNGLWTFFITWGITIGPVSQRYSYVVCAGLFLVINVTGIMTLLAFVR